MTCEDASSLETTTPFHGTCLASREKRSFVPRQTGHHWTSVPKSNVQETYDVLERSFSAKILSFMELAVAKQIIETFSSIKILSAVSMDLLVCRV
jgi:hypothetical protein